MTESTALFSGQQEYAAGHEQSNMQTHAITARNAGIKNRSFDLTDRIAATGPAATSQP
jgi:hypothetical protein